MKQAFLVVLGILRSLADMVCTLVKRHKPNQYQNSHVEGGDEHDGESDCVSSESGTREDE